MAGDITERSKISYLIPDMPEYYQLARFLQRTDKQHWYSNFGPLIKDLEQGICSQFFPQANNRAVTCSSGTAAIELAIKCLELRPGARILVPSFTFPATVIAILNCGYEPVFSDVNEQSWLLTADIAREVVSKHVVDAVLPVSTMGMPQNIQKWECFYSDTGIPVVIDAAPAIEGQEVSDHISVCFSLHATKLFGVGEGGFVVFPSERLAEKGRRLTNFGFEDGVIRDIGGNYKLSEYHGAVGLAQLERVDEISKRRGIVRAHYHLELEKLRGYVDFQQNDDVSLGAEVVQFHQNNIYSSCVLKLKYDDVAYTQYVVTALSSSDIQSRQWYQPAHCHPAFKAYQTVGHNGSDNLDVTQRLGCQLLSLPFHNYLSRDDVAFVCERLSDILVGDYRKMTSTLRKT